MMCCERPLERGVCSGRGGKMFQLAPVFRRQGPRLLPQERRHGQGIVGLPACSAFSPVSSSAIGPALVDRELVDHGLHGERDPALDAPFLRLHDLLESALGLALPGRLEEKSHPAPGHAAQHPESPEILAEFLLHARNDGLRVQIGGPGNDGLNRAMEILVRRSADRPDVSLLQLVDDASNNEIASCRAFHSRSERSR